MSELQTPLCQWHIDHQAKMAPFAGWNMPIQYEGGILAEHLHTRTKASIFDICHMGQILVEGENAPAALALAVSHKLDDLLVGKCRYGFLLNKNGGVIDDLIVYRLGLASFLLVVNAARTDTDLANLSMRLGSTPDVSVREITSTRSKIDLQGPLAYEALESLLGPAAADTNLRKLGYFSFTYAPFQGFEIMISRTGYTGELGYELYAPRPLALPLWEALAATEPVQPAGLGARDTLRLEAGLALYGHELDTNHSPAEAQMAAMLKSTAPYMGKEGASFVRKQLLIPLKTDVRRAARNGDAVALPNAPEQIIGHVSSGSFAPSLGYSIAFAYIDAKYAENQEFILLTGKNPLPATRTTLPFYTAGSVRKPLSL